MSSVKSSEILHREFGVWLQKEREARGISQKFVADRAGFTVTQLSRIENGRSGTRRETVILLAKIIGVDPLTALRKFTPEMASTMPEEFEGIPFYEFDKQDLNEIVDYINFKLFQKRNLQKEIASEIAASNELKRRFSERNTKAKQAEIPFATAETVTENESFREVPTYHFEKGRLVSDSKAASNAHTEQKPSDK
jgi:transcriptional regulator with XRE-family HTH domain